MSPEMSIVEAPAAAATGLLRLSGRLEARAAQELLRRCREMKESGKTRLVLNLANVSFVASSGVGTLLALTEEFKDAGGSVHLASPSQAVTSVVDLLNLTEFLALFDDESQALGTKTV